MGGRKSKTNSTINPTTTSNPAQPRQPISGAPAKAKQKPRVETVEESDEEADEEVKQDDEGEDNYEGSESESEEEKELDDVNSEVIMVIRNRKTQRDETFRMLLDSGTSGCLGTLAAAKRAGLHIHTAEKPLRHNTAAGVFTTTSKAKIKSHKLLELNSRRTLGPRTVTITSGKLGDYDFIFGRKYMRAHGINLLFSEAVIEWDGMRKPMRPKNHWSSPEAIKELVMQVNDPFGQEENYAVSIMDSKYEKQDLKQVAMNQIHLSMKQREALSDVLNKFPSLFEGKLGHWPDSKVTVELKENAVPFHCKRAYPIPHIHVPTLKKEVDRLVKADVIELVDGMHAGPWCAPSFIVPKKDGRVRFITDYRKLNKWIKRKPWPMPHINDMLNDIGQFSYVTALDLSMGFYHFELSEELKQLTTFMLPWGLYRYKRLPMGLCVSPDLFQEHMVKLFADMPFIKVFIDDLLIFSNGTYEDHLDKVKQVLERLQSKNLAVNALKSFWAVKEVDYLGFKLTTQGVLPQPRKVKAIKQLATPKNKKELRRFIGMVNYYRHMWKRRSHLLAPLARMSGKNIPFKWTQECNTAFEEIKKKVNKEVMLSFPDYTKRFELYTDASDKQLGAVLMQGEKVLAFFSKKLNNAQQKYGVGEKEMLSVVEALKDFYTMIHGYPIDVFIDHKNWTHDRIIRNARVMHWRLTLEDEDITWHYIQGEKNVVADTLSRHPMSDWVNVEKENDVFLLEEAFEHTTWREMPQPLTMAEIGIKQKKDPYVKKVQEQAPDRLGEVFEDIGRKSGPDRVLTEIDPKDGKARVLVPVELRNRLVDWYHGMLVHPGANRLHNTLRQHFTWPGMQQQIRTFTRHCSACQKGKRGLQGKGHVPMKDVETEPWKDIALDLAGPWKANVNGEEISFHTFTIIDVFTGWPEILPITTKKMEVIRDLLVRNWFRRYPRPSRMIFDAGGEFDNQVLWTEARRWFVNPQPITVKNPRANAIVERMHQVLGDMLRCQLASKHPKEDVVEELTSAAAFGMRATVHGVTKFTPAQLVFNKDLLLRTNMEANVELVRQRRANAIAVNTERENRRRIAYDYKEGDKVLILSGGLDPKLKLHSGPYKVLSVNKSTGTLHIRRNNYVEPINIRNVRPYFGASRGGD